MTHAPDGHQVDRLRVSSQEGRGLARVGLLGYAVEVLSISLIYFAVWSSLQAGLPHLVRNVAPTKSLPAPICHRHRMAALWWAHGHSPR
jgi:hypothetical protein